MNKEEKFEISAKTKISDTDGNNYVTNVRISLKSRLMKEDAAVEFEGHGYTKADAIADTVAKMEAIKKTIANEVFKLKNK